MIVAFDIDGTLANTRHREELARAKKWGEFHALAHLDTVFAPTAAVLLALRANGHKIEIWTARPDEYEQSTREWLEEQGLPYDRLLMRKTGDWRRAFIIKLEWYLQRPLFERPALVFEDHPETTRLLRAAGCLVHQVAEGHQSP